VTFQNNPPFRNPGQSGVPAPKQPLLRPRKVRGGVKLPLGQGIGVKPAQTADQVAPPPSTQSWAAQRWGRFVEQVAPGESLLEGLEYASNGQTKRLIIQAGLVDGSVQGREFRAYVSRLEMPTFKEEQWAEVVAALADSAIYSAKLLSGEVPANIEDIFAPLGLKLFPAEAADVKATCTCGHPTPWCKHVCCVAHLFAARLSSDPFLMFVLRGIETDDLRERLRQKRVVVGAATGSAPVYSQRISGASDVSSPPLDQSLASFYEAGDQLATLETPIAPPPVSHPLLRRLGPSPFLSAPFPLVGLLASCYETISAETISGTQQAPPVEEPVEESIEQPTDDADLGEAERGLE
jgi:uncharacterized Zn finger protein